MPYESTIIITGGTSGLGYATALSLSASHPTTQIIITGRTLPPNALSATPNNNITYLPLDLTAHASVRSFVSTYKAQNHPPISALLLNAGLQDNSPIKYSPDGIEIMFAVNHVNHALLFFLLADCLLPNARIVSVASSTHDPKFGRTTFDYTTAENAAHHPAGSSTASKTTGTEVLQRYGLSKLANVLFTYALHTYTKQTNKAWIVTALDPGVMPTKLYRDQKGVFGAVLNWLFGSGAWLTRWFIHDLYPTEYTAETLAKMATEETFGEEAVNGGYFGVEGAKRMESSEKSHDKDAQRDLWDWTVKQVLDEEERGKWAM